MRILNAFKKFTLTARMENERQEWRNYIKRLCADWEKDEDEWKEEKRSLYWENKSLERKVRDLESEIRFWKAANTKLVKKILLKLDELIK